MSETEWIDIFGDNLVDILKYNRMTQEDAVIESGLSRSSISFYVNKKFMPSLEAAISLAFALDVDIDEFIDFDDSIF